MAGALVESTGAREWDPGRGGGNASQAPHPGGRHVALVDGATGALVESTALQ